MLFIRAWNSSRKRGFPRKSKSKIAQKVLFPRRKKKIEHHTFKKLIVGADDFGALTRRRKAL